MRDKNIKDVNNHILNNNDKKKKKKKNPLNLVKLISSLFKQLIVDVKIIKLTKRECNHSTQFGGPSKKKQILVALDICIIIYKNILKAEAQ